VHALGSGLPGPAHAAQTDTFMTQPSSPESGGDAAAEAGASTRTELPRATPRSIDEHMAATREYQLLRQQALSQASVASFVKAVCRSVLPLDLWGTHANRAVFEENIDRFVRLRRFEQMTLRAAMVHIKLMDVPWLSVCGARRHALADPSPLVDSDNSAPMEAEEKTQPAAWRLQPGCDNRESEGEGRRRGRGWVQPEKVRKWTAQMEHVVFWVFEHLVIPVIRTHFYVTEAEETKQRVLYFRKPVWARIHTLALQLVIERVYEPVGAHSPKLGPLGYSVLRLLPRGSTLRPIVNLGRRVICTSGGAAAQFAQPKRHVSVNSILSPLFQVMCCEKERQPERMGSSVLGMADVHRKLLPFVQQWTRLGKPPLSFVRTDITKAFDSVEHTKLLQVCSRLFDAEEYIVQRYVASECQADVGCRHRFKSVAYPRSYPQFEQLARTEATTRRNAVFTDQVFYKFEEAEALTKLLEEHVCNHVVKVNRAYYRQRTGIPQGSVLSSLLCSLHYGDMERLSLLPRMDARARSHETEPSLMMRLIDDFLFITPQRPRALAFVTAMSEGDAVYGCRVNMQKTLVNFASQVHGFALPTIGIETDSSQWLPWCGLLVNMKTLEVRGDYSRYASFCIRDTMTVQADVRPGLHLRRKLDRFMMLKCHALLFDSQINSWHTIHTNVYHICLMSAIRFACYVRALTATANMRPEFLARVVDGSIRSMYTSVSAQQRARLAHAGANSEAQAATAVVNSVVRRKEVVWLGYHAFWSVLRKKRGSFWQLLQLLREHIVNERYDPICKKMRQIVAVHNSSALHRISF
jgi:telomerase reverse transcriptase